MKSKSWSSAARLIVKPPMSLLATCSKSRTSRINDLVPLPLKLRPSERLGKSYSNSRI